MKKNFLLLLLLTLLPLAGWAQSLSFTTATYDGSSHALPTVTYSGNTIPVSTSDYVTISGYRYRCHWTYGGSSLGTGTTYTNAGTYTVVIERRSTSSGSQWSVWNQSHTLQVNRINNSMTGLAMSDWMFGTPWVDPTYTTVGYATGLVWEYSSDGTNWAAAPPATIGDWYVRANIPQSTNYNAFTSASVSFKVNPAEVTLKAWSITINYKDSEPTVETIETQAAYDITGATLNEVKPYLIFAREAGDDAGSYAYSLSKNTVTGAENYNIKFDNTAAQLTIVAIDATTAVAPVALSSNIVYDGNEHTLCDLGTGAPEGTAWKYRVDGGEWVAEPKATDVDEYLIEYMFENGINYNPIAGGNLGTIKIEPADPISTPAAAVASLVYSNEEKALISAAELTALATEKGVVVEYRVGTTGEWSTDVPKETNAGNYDVYVRYNYDGTSVINPNFEYNDGTLVATVNIAKADPTITVTSVGGATTSPEFTYNAPDFNTANFTYDYDFTGYDGTPDSYAFKKNGTSTPWDGSAGDWTVAVTFTKGTNWNIATTAPFAFTVGKAENEFTTAPVITDATLIYDGTAKSLLKNFAAVAINGNGEIQYKVDYTPNVGTEDEGTWGTAEPQGTAAGTYKIYYRATEGDNYQAIAATTEPLVVTIEKSFVTHTGTPAVIASALTFDGTDQPLLQSGKYFTGITGGHVTYYAQGTVDAAATEYTKYSDVKGKNAGEYTVSYKFFADDKNNYKDDEDVTEIGKVTIKQFTLYVGGNEVTGTIEDVVNLETNTPKVTMANFLPVDKVTAQLPAGDASADVAAILNQLVAPAGDIAAIIANAKVGTNPIALQKVDVAPAEGKPMNYQVDENHLLSNAASLTITAIEAAIQTAPEGYADDELTYNGANQALVKTAGVGYKAMGGTGSVAIGKIVYSTTGEDGSWTEDLTVDGDIVGKNQGTYTVYYKVELSEEDKPENLDRFYEYTAGVKSIQVKINKKELALGMFKFDPASLTAEYTGGNLKPTVTAFDAVAGDAEKNALTEDDFTVTVTNSDGGEETGDLSNVGVYTFTFTAKADGNYKNPATAVTADFEITQKALDADMFALVTEGDVIFNGDPQQPTITAKDGESTPNPLQAGDWTYVIKNSKGTEVNIDEMVNADTYTFTFSADGGNYKDATAPITKTFVIAPKALADGMFTLGPDDLEYTGADQKASVTVTATDKKGDKNIITTEDFVETKVEYGTPAETVDKLINAGTYTYTFTGQGNYTGTAQATISIAKIEAKPIVEPTEIHLTYNNTDQALVTEGSTPAVGGKVEYQVSDAEGVIVAWTEDYDKVVATNAGTYFVDYRITASDVNYTNPSVTPAKPIEVTILKAEISYTIGNVTKDWDGQPFTEDEINSLFAINNGELFGSDKYDRPFDFDVPEDYRDAGEYTFTVSQKDVVFKEGYPENYDVKINGEATLVINKVDIDATAITAPEAIADLVYKNGTENAIAQDLVKAGEIAETAANAEDYPNTEIAGKPFGTIVYATAKDGEYTEDIPQGTDAGNYEIWWKVVGDINHNDTEPAKIKNTIAANGTGFQLAFENDTWTYDGVEFYPADVNAYDGKTATEPGIATDPETDYDFALTKDGEEFSGKLKDVGTYVFTYTGKGNYEGSSAQATIVITRKDIADADVTVTLSATTAEFNNENQKPTYEVKYAPAEKPELTLVEAEGENANDFSVAADDDMTTGGEYTFTFTGNGNYTGTKTAKFNIAKRVVIAQAEDVEKVYDGYYGLAIADGKFVEVPITWGNLVPGDKNVPTLGEGAITVEPYKNAVGKYTIIVDGSKFESDNYEVKKGQREAFLTITPAPLTVKWGDKMAEKIYGTADDTADPALASCLEIEGAVGAEVDDIRANTVITRAKGETVGTYAVTLSAEKDEDDNYVGVFANYDVTFEGADEAFEIKKAELTVSLTPQKVTYTGVKAVLDDLTAEDLLVNGLIVNPALGINDYKDVVTTMPEIIVPDDAINVGSYELKFKEGTGDAANYKFNFLNATLDIEAFDISKAKVTIPEQQVRVGDVAEDVINADGFTVELEGFTDVNAAEFQVVAADRFVDDADGKIKNGDNPEKGLVLVPVDATAQKNYTGWENDAFTGNLIIVGAASLLLDDSQDIATTDQNGVDVTFTSRKINQDTWNVVCLPFNATIKQISEAFGYAAVDLLKRDSSDGSMHFIITSSGTVPAGEPFIVKPTSDEELKAKSNFNQITFFGVNVKAYTGNPEPVEDSAGNKFCGTFKAQTTIKGENFWYMSKGMWKHSVEKPVNIAAYRAYLETATADARIFVEEPDGTITAISGITAEGQLIEAEGWYTVNGMKLNAAPTEKGTYIKDGKKVLVK